MSSAKMKADSAKAWCGQIEWQSREISEFPGPELSISRVTTFWE